ncbi:MAG: radical SAM protein [Deltaproteobacteria bacterium]
MRITLVAIHPYPSPQAVPLANAFLQSSLDNSKFEIALEDFFIDQEIVECVEKIVALNPAAVGLSMYVWNRATCLKLARSLKQLIPALSLFAGGPEATADPDGVMAGAPFDFLIVGEGESPFAAACERLRTGKNLQDIKGIAMRSRGGIILTPNEPLSELDSIPSPYLTGILDTTRYQGILWQLSRGCPFSCDFCFDSRDRHGVRRFSLERVEAELRHFAAKGVSQVFVLDSTFNQDIKRAKTILRLIKKIAPRIHFHFEVRSEFIDQDMARLFASITCSLQIGLQSSDPLVLKGIGRSFNRDSFATKIGFLNASGAVFGLDLIYGLPDDTPEGFAKSLDFALGLYPNQLDIFPLAVLPGTRLATRSGAIGLKYLPDPPYTLISSTTYSSEDLCRTKTLATACDIFYTRGKAVAWFNGVIKALRLKPSLFMKKFAEWLAAEKSSSIDEASLDDREIRQLQRDFLTRMFSRKTLRRFLPAVLDLVDYHYHYAAAILTPQAPLLPDRKSDKKGALEQAFVLATSTRLVTFHYGIYDLLDAGEPDFREIADNFEPTGSWVAIYPHAGEIHTESFDEPYFRLLEQLDYRTPTCQIAARLHIPADDARSFLEFAIAEGIILQGRTPPPTNSE